MHTDRHAITQSQWCRLDSHPTSVSIPKTDQSLYKNSPYAKTVHTIDGVGAI